MREDVIKIKERIISAGEKAVKELIKVAEEDIIKFDADDDLAADRLKNAAATKKLAIFDAFEILQRIEEERAALNGEELPQIENTNQGFAERRSKK
tara:strand:+ start:340 stop:627 length:288 start_codon:yes stop_codon:yes gene_type:complete